MVLIVRSCWWPRRFRAPRPTAQPSRVKRREGRKRGVEGAASRAAHLARSCLLARSASQATVLGDENGPAVRKSPLSVCRTPRRNSGDRRSLYRGGNCESIELKARI